MPKVSIIIPVFNAERYLNQCIESVLRQTFRDYELLCIDDGSTDGSLEILERHASVDDRIHIFQQANCGAGVARNLGISRASGEYLYFMDADDYCHERLLELACQKIEQTESDVVAFHYYRVFDDTGEIELRKSWNPALIPPHKRTYSYRDFPNSIFGVVNITPWNKLIRRQLIENNTLRYMELSSSNDITFNALVMACADRFCLLDKPLYYYRVNAVGSISSSKSKNLNNVIQAVEGVAERCLQFAHEKELLPALSNFVVDNTVFTLKQYAPSTSAVEFCKYYSQLVALYHAPFFEHTQPEDFAYPELYKAFKSIRNATFRELNHGIVTKDHIAELQNARQKVKIAQFRAKDIIVYHRSYQIGCAITWLPRKIRGGVRCLKEQGWSYTLKRGLEHLGIPMGIKLMPHARLAYGLNKSPRQHRIVVSLTSYPARIQYVEQAVISLLQQSTKPDRLLLWLAKDEFPSRLPSLPWKLLRLMRYGLEIRWCDNLYSYKKLIPTLKEYPNDIIITTDDDLYYNTNMIEQLYNAYLKNPNMIHCHRGSKTKYLGPDNLEIIFGGAEYYSVPSYLNRLCSGAGCLFPPHQLSDLVAAQDLFLQLAPTNDDIWFWLMAVLNETKINVVDDPLYRLSYIKDSQDGPCLWKVNNVNEKLFFKDFYSIINAFPELKETLNNEQIEMDSLERAQSVPWSKKDYMYYKELPSTQYRAELCLWYQKNLRKRIDIDHPYLFTEKVQWLKLNNSTPMKTQLTDKYLARFWVSEKIGEEYLVPQLGVWGHFEDINFDLLPDQFVLKCNHGSGWNIIVKDKNKLNLTLLKEKFDLWMSKDFAFINGLELHYCNIKPKIIAEEYLHSDVDIPDYKVLCFNGTPAYIWVDTDRFVEHKRDIFDLNWDLVPFRIGPYQNNAMIPPKPLLLDNMLRLAKILSNGFSFVRIDFYVYNGKLYFGEMTFTSESGGTRITPQLYDEILGNLLHLPCEPSINS
ncbi:MAG: glycosyltransferase [Clostridiales bacterium]|nr:glycosyltransferase [Clostridiales bacterium]